MQRDPSPDPGTARGCRGAVSAVSTPSSLAAIVPDARLEISSTWVCSWALSVSSTPQRLRSQLAPQHPRAHRQEGCISQSF
ncbi:MAG: hypothetical protein ACK46L_03820 [Synechococcaceae cyanobacterium]